MVGADSSILGDLGELGEMFTIFGAGECGGIVAEVFGDDDSKIASQSFEILFSLEGLVGIEMNLVVDEDKTRGMVSEESSTNVLCLKTTLGCYPEDETRIKDGKERLELKRGSESRWTYRIRPIRFIHVRWTGIYALTATLLFEENFKKLLLNQGSHGANSGHLALLSCLWLRGWKNGKTL